MEKMVYKWHSLDKSTMYAIETMYQLNQARTGDGIKDGLRSLGDGKIGKDYETDKVER